MSTNTETTMTTSSMDDKINEMIGTTNDNIAPKKEYFIPSKTYQGKKEGYYFSTTPEYGTGYYVDNNQPNHKKRNATSDSNNTKKSVRFGTATIKTIPKEELLKEAESNVSPYTKILTISKTGIKSSVHSLQKSIETNQIQRSTFKNDPEKYFDSEMTLYEELSCWKALAIQPTYYRYLIDETGWLDCIMELLLLPHENIDIQCCIINILVELLDLSLLDNEEEAIRENLQWLSQACIYWKSDEYDFITIISNVLVSLSVEKQDSATQKGIEDVLTLLDTFLDMENVYKFFDGFIVLPKIACTKLIPWVFEQIGTNEYTKEKLQYSEFLFTLLQIEITRASTYNTTELATLSSSNKNDIDGIEMLLQGIAPYRKKDPVSLDEVETLENYINSLSSVLSFTSTSSYKKHFLELQGVELLIHCLKSLKHVSHGSLKVMESCLFFINDKYTVSQQACETFISNNGFKYLFPIFMGRSIPKPSLSSNISNKKSKREWLSTIEENCIQILYNMTRLVSSEHKDCYERLLVKFIENDYEKCTRLIELTLKYDVKMRKAEGKFFKSEEAEFYYEQNANAQNEVVDVDLLAFEYKLKHGGDIFHRLGAILGFVCVGSKRCHGFILEGLKIHRSGIGVIKAALDEFINVLEDGDQKSQLMTYQEQI